MCTITMCFRYKTRLSVWKKKHYLLQYISVFMTYIQVARVSGSIACNCRVISKFWSENELPGISRHLICRNIPVFKLRASEKPCRISANKVSVLGKIRTRRFLKTSPEVIVLQISQLDMSRFNYRGKPFVFQILCNPVGNVTTNPPHCLGVLPEICSFGLTLKSPN